MCDDGNPLPSLCDTAFVFLVVEPVNDPPQAVDDRDTTEENTATVIDVVANDTDSLDPLGNIDPTTVDTVAGGSPQNGSITIDPVTGAITYTPDPAFTGNDTIQYTVCDDGNPLPAACDTAFIYIVVTEFNDPPVAVNDRDTTDEETEITIDLFANDGDPDGDMLSVTAIDVPMNGMLTNHGDGTITYTPETDFVGQEVLNYTISDGNMNTDSAQVTINVDPVNDAPTAVLDTDTTNEDEDIILDLVDNDLDVDMDTLSVIFALMITGYVAGPKLTRRMVWGMVFISALFVLPMINVIYTTFSRVNALTDSLPKDLIETLPYIEAFSLGGAWDLGQVDLASLLSVISMAVLYAAAIFFVFHCHGKGTVTAGS